MLECHQQKLLEKYLTICSVNNVGVIFRTTQIAYQYYLTVSPADGHLYVSDPEKHQILKVISLEPVSDPSINSEPVSNYDLIFTYNR